MKPVLKRISVVLLILLSTLPARADDIVFIVNAENPITQITNGQIANFFLKKKREWADATAIRFIDRKDGTPVRREFLSEYVGRTGRDVELYWIGQKLYSGDAAPMQVDSDKSVMSLVSALRGAIGYVSAETPLTESVKKIEVIR